MEACPGHNTETEESTNSKRGFPGGRTALAESWRTWWEWGFLGTRGEVESHWRPTMIGWQSWKGEPGVLGNSLASSHGGFWALGSSLHLYILLWLGLREEDVVWRRTSKFSLHVNSMSEAFHSLCSDCHQTRDSSHMVNVNCQPWQSLGASLLEIVSCFPIQTVSFRDNRAWVYRSLLHSL